MPIEPPSDILTIRAWIECDGKETELRARLIFAPNATSATIRRVVTTNEGVLSGVREWLDRLEQKGVTYCETIE